MEILKENSENNSNNSFHEEEEEKKTENHQEKAFENIHDSKSKIETEINEHFNEEKIEKYEKIEKNENLFKNLLSNENPVQNEEILILSDPKPSPPKEIDLSNDIFIEDFKLPANIPVPPSLFGNLDYSKLENERMMMLEEDDSSERVIAEEEEEKKMANSNENPEENAPQNSEIQPEPALVYGHTLEDFIYNVNNLRGHLNRLKQATEAAGFDSSIIENLDNSFSRAISGIQEKIGDVHKLINESNEHEVAPGVSEALMNQWISENHSLLSHITDNMQKNDEEEKEAPKRNKIVENFRKIKNFTVVFGKALKNFAAKIYITMKNPKNIFKFLVLLLSIIFCSGFKQMPNFEKYGEFFDWLAYSKTSKTLLFVYFIIFLIIKLFLI